jgi:hypothetical protein
MLLIDNLGEQKDMANEKEKVFRIIDIIQRDEVFGEFEFKAKFIDEWKNYIKSVDSKVRYILPEESDVDQVFIFTMPIETDEMEFQFSIKYIRDFYIKYPNCKQELILENSDGRLYNGENECCYTHLNEADVEKEYEDDTEAFVIPFPQVRYNFLVIDGNHRMNQKIYSGDKEIRTLYVDYKMAARSLATPMQICAYCILEDYAKIKYNLNKYEHRVLLKSSNIIKKDRTLSIVNADRKR